MVDFREAHIGLEQASLFFSAPPFTEGKKDEIERTLRRAMERLERAMAVMNEKEDSGTRVKCAKLAVFFYLYRKLCLDAEEHTASLCLQFIHKTLNIHVKQWVADVAYGRDSAAAKLVFSELTRKKQEVHDGVKEMLQVLYQLFGPLEDAIGYWDIFVNEQKSTSDSTAVRMSEGNFEHFVIVGKYAVARDSKEKHNLLVWYKHDERYSLINHNETWKWDVYTNNCKLVLVGPAEVTKVRCVGRLHVLVQYSTAEVIVWNVESEEARRRITIRKAVNGIEVHTLGGQLHTFPGMHKLFAVEDVIADDHQIAIAYSNNSIHLWDFQTNKQVLLLSGGGWHPVLAMDDTHIFSLSSSTLQMWDRRTGNCVGRCDTPVMGQLHVNVSGLQVVGGIATYTIEYLTLGRFTGSVVLANLMTNTCRSLWKGSSKATSLLSSNIDSYWNIVLHHQRNDLSTAVAIIPFLHQSVERVC